MLTVMTLVLTTLNLVLKMVMTLFTVDSVDDDDDPGVDDDDNRC